MSEEKKYTKTEEICEEVKELSMEDLDNVTGGKGDKVLQEAETFSLETVCTM